MASLAQLGRVDRQAELVVRPAGQGPPAPVLEEELLRAGARSTASIVALAFSTRKSSRLDPVEDELVALELGELAEVLVLEVGAVPGVEPGGQGQPVVLGGLGVGGQVLLDRLADLAAGLRLGLAAGLRPRRPRRSGP